MKILFIGVGSILIAALLFFASIYVVSEIGGEVVVLDRKSADGSTTQTRVWIVEDEDGAWIEHGDPDADWITMLAKDPIITIKRDGTARQYRAFADPGMHKRYHDLRQAKYGFADDYVAILGGDGDACGGVPVRIELVPG